MTTKAAQSAASQKRILEFVRWYTAYHRYSPSLREISDASWLVPSAVSYQLRKLAEAGVLTWNPRMARSITLAKFANTGEPPCPNTPPPANIA